MNLDKEWLKQSLEDLKKIGLNEKESLVYLSLLQLGEVGTSKIVSHTGLHSQFVYQALNQLENQGLVQHVIMRGRKKFTAKSPETLSLLIDQKKRLADELTTRLKNVIVMPDTQQFEIFQGEDSFVTHEFDLLDNAKEEDELLVIGGSRDKFLEAMGQLFGEYEYKRTKKKITVRYIGSESQRNELLKAESVRPQFEFRLLPGLFTGDVNTNIWPGSVGFNIFSKPVTNFTVSNKNIAESYKQFFETLWKLAR